MLCLPVATGLTAIIAGLIARGQAARKPTLVGGRGMAMTGILLGILNLIGWTCGLIYALSQS